MAAVYGFTVARLLTSERWRGSFGDAGAIEIDTARYCRTRATPPEPLSLASKGWGAYPDTGTSTMIGKTMIGLAVVTIVSAGATISASAQHKKLKVAIPKQICETVTANTQNWGKQKVQVCGPTGAARGQTTPQPQQSQQQQNK